MQRKSSATSIPTCWVTISSPHTSTSPTSPRRTMPRCTGWSRQSKKTALLSWLWSLVSWRTSSTRWGLVAPRGRTSPALSLTWFNLGARLFAGGPGHRPGLHRLHRSHDPFPGITLLVCHVLLHANQPRTGKHDRHHDRHYHTSAGCLQDPEGDFNRWASPTAPLGQSCSCFKKVVALQSCSFVTSYQLPITVIFSISSDFYYLDPMPYKNKHNTCNKKCESFPFYMIISLQYNGCVFSMATIRFQKTASIDFWFELLGIFPTCLSVSQMNMKWNVILWKYFIEHVRLEL